MHVSGHGRVPADPSASETPAGDPSAAAPERAPSKTAASASDPTGLGWRAKLGGQSFVADAQKTAAGLIATDDYKTAIDGSALPGAAKQLFDKYTKEAAKSGGDADPEAFPGAPSAYKFPVDGKDVFMVFHDTTESESRATLFDAAGKKLTSGTLVGPGGTFDWH